MRYDYAQYKTLAKAQAALEDMFASGDVCEGEQPRIENRSGRTRTGAPLTHRFTITLAGC